jgi:3-hydroxybutyrate dehydrogenase
MSKPSEIGQLCAWLCHPVAHNITGSAIPIEGGWTSQ